MSDELCQHLQKLNIKDIEISEGCEDCKRVKDIENAFCFTCGRVVCSGHRMKHDRQKHVIYTHKTNEINCPICKKTIKEKSMTLSKQLDKLKPLSEEDEVNLKKESETVELAIESRKIEYRDNRTPVGLNNLGNTCFFNSALQNLANTRGLYPLYNQYQTIIKSSPITSTFYHTINAMMNSNRTINPQSLFSRIGSLNRRFRGYNQQDSQELYHVLLDGIDMENKKKGNMNINEEKNLEKEIITEAYKNDKPDSGYRPKSLIKNISYYFDNLSDDIEIEMGERDDDVIYNENEKENEKVESITVNNSITSIPDLVFGGKYCTVIECQHCFQKNHVQTPFYDLSLALPGNVVLKRSNNKRNTVDYSKNSTSREYARLPKEKAEFTGTILLPDTNNIQLLEKYKRNMNNKKIDIKELVEFFRSCCTKEFIEYYEIPPTKKAKTISSKIGKLKKLLSEVIELYISQGGVSNNKEKKCKTEKTENENEKEEYEIFSEEGKKKMERLKLEDVLSKEKKRDKVEVLLSVVTDEYLKKNKLSKDMKSLIHNLKVYQIDEILKKLFGLYEEEKNKVKDDGNNNDDNTKKEENNENDKVDEIDDKLENVLITNETKEETKDEDIDGEIEEVKDEDNKREDNQETNNNIEEAIQEVDNTDHTNDDGNNKKENEEKEKEKEEENNSNSKSELSEPINLEISDLSDLLEPPEPVINKSDYSLDTCLQMYTSSSMLLQSENNGYLCQNCCGGDSKSKVRRDAKIRTLISELPQTLVIHLKRFQQSGNGYLSKRNEYVKFPLILDMKPYSLNEGEVSILYSLRGIVQHGGSLHGGHYTSYINTAESKDDNSHWFHISDSSVRGVSVEQVMQCSGFMYFYEKC